LGLIHIVFHERNFLASDEIGDKGFCLIYKTMGCNLMGIGQYPQIACLQMV
jgi:hypothetical protein